jgi:RNA polymerase sigma factor (sigma-70 family)
MPHCYRMLGSMHDAGDLVQQTYLRAWRGYEDFEGRSSLRTWLYRSATRACLNELDRARVGNGHDVCPIAAARGTAQLVLAGLSAPTRRTVAVGAMAIPVELVMLTGALEGALHGWDVGHAADSSRRLPPGLADELLAIAALLVTDQDRGSLFARRIVVPGCATSADRLVAYMGRDPYPNRYVAET